MKENIPITDAKPGMVLAKAITNDKNMTLCAEGTPLTEDLIDRFSQMEIDNICIENNKEMSQEEYLELKEKIEKRFVASYNPNSLLGKIKIALLEHLESQKGSS